MISTSKSIVSKSETYDEDVDEILVFLLWKVYIGYSMGVSIKVDGKEIKNYY